MKKLKTHLEVRNGNNLIRSQWIDIKKGFLLGETYSPVGFCCTKIPVMLLEKSDGYKMGPADKRVTKCTNSLFIDDFKNISAKPPKAEDAKFAEVFKNGR